MKSKIKFVLKLIFGIAILAFLFSKTSVQEFAQLLGNANYKYFIVATFLYILGKIISAKKWMILAELLHFNNKFIRYLRLYFLGMFYNTFLPTNIGGDIIKVLKLQDEKEHPINRAIISVLSDRITGAVLLSFFIFWGFIFYHTDTITNIFNTVALTGITISLFLFIIVLKNRNIIPEKYRIIHDYVKSLCNKKCILKIIILSLISHIILIFIHFCIAKMYNLSVPITYYLLLYPITTLIASLPISINGIGLKEGVYVYMLKMFEIDTSSAIIFAMTYNMVVLFSSLLGFIPYITKEKLN